MMFLFLPETILSHFMQLASKGDSLHEMSKRIFRKKKKKKKKKKKNKKKKQKTTTTTTTTKKQTNNKTNNKTIKILSADVFTQHAKRKTRDF